MLQVDIFAYASTLGSRFPFLPSRKRNIARKHIAPTPAGPASPANDSEAAAIGDPQALSLSGLRSF
jgi:hypothetical protein